MRMPWNLKERKYCIHNDYEVNQYPRISHTHELSADIVNFTKYLVNKSNISRLILITESSNVGLESFKDLNIDMLVIYHSEDSPILSQEVGVTFTSCNLEKDIPSISRGLTEHSLVLVFSIIEKLREPHNLLSFLGRLSHRCPFVLMLSPDRQRVSGAGVNRAKPWHVREWNLDEFIRLMNVYKFLGSTGGHTTGVDFQKNMIIGIAGCYCYKETVHQVKTLAIINHFNDYDILQEVIGHILAQDLYLYIIDNWSNDGSYERIQRDFAGHSKIQLTRSPQFVSNKYEWEKLLVHVEETAVLTDFDWIVHYDSDEFRYSPWREVTLGNAINFIDELGYNAIDFTVLDFRPVKQWAHLTVNAYEKNIPYFEFGSRPGHFIQIKAWKNQCKVNLHSSGGHEAIFQDRKVFPLKFLTKHYPLRNEEQAHKKIFRDRLNRITEDEKNRGWHMQYNIYQDKPFQLWDANNLTHFIEPMFESEYIVERLSGIGIIR